VPCVFNLSPGTHSIAVEGAGEAAISEAAERHGDTLKLHPNGFAIMEVVGPPHVVRSPRPDRRLTRRDRTRADPCPAASRRP
jgi:hypothetical protein